MCRFDPKGTSSCSHVSPACSLAIYAAQGSGNALTIVVINKTNTSLSSSIDVAGYEPAATAAVYRYSAANPDAIVRASDLAVAASGFQASFPAASITTLVLAPLRPLDQRLYLPLLRK